MENIGKQSIQVGRTGSAGIKETSSMFHKMSHICGFPFRHRGTPVNNPFRTMGFSLVNHPAILGGAHDELERASYGIIWK